MLDFIRTRVVESNEFPVAQGSTITAEGRGLVADYAGGVFGVKEATGDEDEKFVGVSISQQITPEALPMYLSVTVPASAPYTVNLPRAPIAGSAAFFDGSTKLTIVAIAPTAGEVQLVGNTATFHSGQANKTIRVQMRYVPNVLEIKTIQGDIPPSGAASYTLGTMGVIVKGLVGTTEFDTSIDWNVANPTLAVGADGLFTLDDGVATVTPVVGAVITQLPQAGGQTENKTTLVFELS